MAWINGRWVDEQQGFGGMLGGFGGQPRFEEGYTGDTSLDVIDSWNPPPLQPTPPTWVQGPPFMPGPQPPFGDRPGVPNLPPQMNPPGYSRGPQMQSPFGGGLGDITQWNPVQQSVQQPQFQPLPDMRARAIAEAQQAARMPAPQVRPPMPPPPPNIVDVWPQPEPPQVRPPMPPPIPPMFPPDVIYDPPLPRTDHEFNVAQREKTKARLAADRSKTRKHYAKLRAKGASKQTIAKAKAKSKARSAKIKGQSLRRATIKN